MPDRFVSHLSLNKMRYRRAITSFAVGLILLTSSLILERAVAAETASDAPAAFVKSVLDRPESDRDYARAAMAFDQLLDPSGNAAITEAMIARLADAARQMAGPKPTDAYKLAAVRKAIYDAGPWNHDQPFQYDQSIAVADSILAVNLRDAYTMGKKGTAIEGLLRNEFFNEYATPALIPPPLRTRYQMLASANAKAFKDAEALGWEPAN